MGNGQSVAYDPRKVHAGFNHVSDAWIRRAQSERRDSDALASSKYNPGTDSLRLRSTTSSARSVVGTTDHSSQPQFTDWADQSNDGRLSPSIAHDRGSWPGVDNDDNAMLGDKVKDVEPWASWLDVDADAENDVNAEAVGNALQSVGYCQATCAKKTAEYGGMPIDVVEASTAVAFVATDVKVDCRPVSVADNNDGVVVDRSLDVKNIIVGDTTESNTVKTRNGAEDTWSCSINNVAENSEGTPEIDNSFKTLTKCVGTARGSSSESVRRKETFNIVDRHANENVLEATDVALDADVWALLEDVVEAVALLKETPSEPDRIPTGVDEHSSVLLESREGHRQGGGQDAQPPSSHAEHDVLTDASLDSTQTSRSASGFCYDPWYDPLYCYDPCCYPVCGPAIYPVPVPGPPVYYQQPQQPIVIEQPPAVYVNQQAPQHPNAPVAQAHQAPQKKKFMVRDPEAPGGLREVTEQDVKEGKYRIAGQPQQQAQPAKDQQQPEQQSPSPVQPAPPPPEQVHYQQTQPSPYAPTATPSQNNQPKKHRRCCC